MARLIPPVVPASCPSRGERELFAQFRDDARTQDWVILHSIGVARHPKRLAGEVDFVVLVPGEGILCLEVKAGAVRRREGVWIYGSPPAETQSSVGPFRQASDGMHAIRRYVNSMSPSLSGLLFASAVVFTAHGFDERSPEWLPWQIIDRAALERYAVSGACLRALGQAQDQMRRTPSASWYRDTQSRPTRKQVLEIASLLRRDFEVPIPERSLFAESERRVTRFTEEQFGALDALQDNPRLLFKGPAGTGKTFLAVEAARRSAENGVKTLLCCFNRALGQWLGGVSKTTSADTDRNLSAVTLHSYLLRLSGLLPPRGAGGDFWGSDLPRLVVDRLLGGELPTPLFDYLAIDEAQDLLTGPYLDFFDLALAGGLGGGRWAMFGDLERQSLYTSASQAGSDPASLLRARADYFVYPLRVNCRNTSEIAATVELLANLKPGYSRVLNQESGKDPEFRFYDNEKHQQMLLGETLRQLCRVFRPGEIAVLSTVDDSSCCASRMDGRELPAPLVPLRDSSDPGSMRYGTVHAFKGLDAPAVVLTDIYRLAGSDAEALLYVGLSRARFRLVALIAAGLRPDWLSALSRHFGEDPS